MAGDIYYGELADGTVVTIVADSTGIPAELADGTVIHIPVVAD